jgi:hypothetical protein
MVQFWSNPAEMPRSEQLRSVMNFSLFVSALDGNCLISHDLGPPFHGGNTGSNPVRDTR